MQGHIEPTSVPGNGFIDTIVNNFLRQVIGPRCIGKHAGAFAHRLKAT